jgi:hypothetical protein
MVTCYFEQSEKSSHQKTELISPVGRNDRGRDPILSCAMAESGLENEEFQTVSYFGGDI